jgi:DNA-binding transcriptional LysR family regulator
MQLEMFVAVVEEGSVRRAAECVLRTQPAVSIAISKLELEFEAALFDRSKYLARLDLVLLSFRPDDGDVEAKFVLQDELVLITAAGHPLSRKGMISVEDLCEESILVMDVSEPSPWHQKISEAFVRCKTQLHLTVENAPIETIKKMVGIGLGVAFVPKLAVREEEARGELAVVEVDGLCVERSVWLVRRRAVQSPAAKEFVQTALAFGEELRAGNCASLGPPLRSNSAKGAKVVMVKRGA